MTVPTAVPDEQAPRAAPPGRGFRALTTVLACAAQALVLMFTFLMGLQWGGATYLAALLQAAAAFALIARLAARGRGVVLLVPLVSVGLTAGLAGAGQALARATACSDQERAAARQLTPPPGTAVQFQGDQIEGCIARTRMNVSSKEILEHYQAEFARHGWQETPGRHEATIGTAAVKDGIHLVVDIETGEEAGAAMLEVVVGDADSTAPCLTNTVDGYLERRPTRTVEPGQWSMLVSTDTQPASVVIRDRTGAVVLEQQAHPRPDGPDDLSQIDELPEGVPTLALEEGDYEVECRPADGAATRVALPVAWAEPDPVGQEKTVVLRVFETPDHWK